MSRKLGRTSLLTIRLALPAGRVGSCQFRFVFPEWRRRSIVAPGNEAAARNRGQHEQHT